MSVPPTRHRFGDKRYYAWHAYLKSTFGRKVFKVPVDGGFTCPNRDGTAARYGCTFCSQRGSGDFAGDRREDLARQFRTVRDRMHRKWRDGLYIGYFQAFSNTYAPVSELREKYETIIEQDGVVGLSVATRPDCLPPPVVEYLAELNRRTFLWVELGLQTVHQRTATRINRAHDFACFVEGVEALRRRGIRVCVHIINGLPGETSGMMLETAERVAQLDIQGIKIHLLHVLKHTKMAGELDAKRFRLLGMEEYVRIVCDQLEILPEDIVIHRLTGDGPRDLLIGPRWSLRKWEVLNAIDAELERRDTFQGRLAPALAVPRCG